MWYNPHSDHPAVERNSWVRVMGFQRQRRFPAPLIAPPRHKTCNRPSWNAPNINLSREWKARASKWSRLASPNSKRSHASIFKVQNCPLSSWKNKRLPKIYSLTTWKWTTINLQVLRSAELKYAKFMSGISPQWRKFRTKCPLLNYVLWNSLIWSRKKDFQALAPPYRILSALHRYQAWASAKMRARQ